MNNPFNLSQEDLDTIEEVEKLNVMALESITSQVNRFKVGDIVETGVREYLDNGGFGFVKNMENGLPVKYYVVYVDKAGCPHYSKVKGKMKVDRDAYDETPFENSHLCGEELSKLTLCRDYADACLLGDIDNYDPTAIIKQKRKEQQKVSAYNKTIAIKNIHEQHTIKFLKTLKVGSEFWMGKSSQFIVQEIVGFNSATDWNKKILTCNKMGKIVKLSIIDLRCKRLYTSQPKTSK